MGAEKKATEKVGSGGKAEEEEEVGGAAAKGPLATAPSSDYGLAANGPGPVKGLEGLGPLEPKTMAAAGAAPNGLAPQEMAPPEEDEDDLLGVTDLVDYVCNSEDL